MSDAWEQQSKESDVSYAKFKAFLKMPSASRSVKKLAEQLNISAKSLTSLSGKYDWFARATAYDNHVEKSVIRPTYLSRISQQEAIYKDNDRDGKILIDIANKALIEHIQSGDPLSLSMALKFLEHGYKMRAFAARIGENKSDVEGAIQTLVEAGYLPDNLIRQTIEHVGEMKEKIQNLFQKEIAGKSILEVIPDEH